MRNLFTILTILFIISGCGVADDPYDRTAPVIKKVVFYTPAGNDFNPEHKDTFNIDDKFDIIVYATDPDLDMETLYITECYYSDLAKEWECSGPFPFALPEQVGVNRGYHFGYPFIMVGPAGSHTFEFQITDHEGHFSNIYEITIEVR